MSCSRRPFLNHTQAAEGAADEDMQVVSFRFVVNRASNTEGLLQAILVHVWIVRIVRMAQCAIDDAGLFFCVGLLLLANYTLALANQLFQAGLGFRYRAPGRS